MSVPSVVLQKYYNINPIKITIIKSGVENKNYLVNSNHGKFVLRFYNQSHSIRGARSIDDIKLELEFVERARNLGIRAPQVVKNKSSNIITTLNTEGGSRFVVLLTFLDGHTLREYSKLSATGLGNTVNKLFEVGKSFQDLDLKLKSDIITRCIIAYHNLETSGINIPETITSLWDQVVEDKGKLHPQIMAKGLVHGDLKLEKLLFDKNENISAVLDFDDFRFSYLIEEPVMAIMHNLHSKEENLLRSGNYSYFVKELKNSDLLPEIDYMKFFMRVRFIYDVTKYLISGNNALVSELLSDNQIKLRILR